MCNRLIAIGTTTKCKWTYSEWDTHQLDNLHITIINSRNCLWETKCKVDGRGCKIYLIPEAKNESETFFDCVCFSREAQ